MGSHLAVSDAISPFSKDSKSSAYADCGGEDTVAVPTRVMATATLDEKWLRKFLRLLSIIIVVVDGADGEPEVGGGAKASA